MRIIKGYVLLLVHLCLCMGAWAGNVVGLSVADGKLGDEVTVSISLDNTDVASSLQVSIPLDENLTIVEGSGLPGSRCSGHTVTVGVKGVELQLFVYSNSMAAMSGNSGEVATFKLKLGRLPGSYTLQPSKVILTNNAGFELKATAQSTVLTIDGARAQFDVEEIDFGGLPIGDATTRTVWATNIGNYDLVITGLKFSDVNVFSTTTLFPITLKPGGMVELNVTCTPKGRGTINEMAQVECNSPSTMNTIRLKGDPFVINTLTIEDVRGVSDEEVTVSINMRNKDAVSGFQLEFDLPQSLVMVDGSFTLSGRKQDHTATVSLEDRTLRIIVYSPEDKPFTGNEGEIASFKVRLNGRESTDLIPTKAILSATINHVVENVLSDVRNGHVTIVCPYLEGEDDINFGEVPVTEKCRAWYWIRNTGEATLTISRITFTNDHFSILNDLPLDLKPHGGDWVEVSYNSIEEVPFEAVMQIHSNDPEMRMKEVKMFGRRFAPNLLAVITPDAFADKQINIAISATNYDPISGIQFDLEYPSDNYLIDENVQLEKYAQGMTLITNRIDSKTIRYICYSPDGKSLPRGSGRLLNISLKPIGGAAPEKTYRVKLKKIKMGTRDMDNKYAGNDIEREFKTVTQMLLGDADENGVVNEEDRLRVQYYIMDEYNVYRFLYGYSDINFALADVNQDGKVNVADLVLITQVLLSVK